MTNRISFTFLNLKPVSLNGLYKSIMIKGKMRRAKSKAGVAYEKRMTLELLNRRFDINKFETETSIYENFLTCKIVCEIPRSKLITKKDYISNISGDVDDMPKPIIDNIFKFFNKLNDAIICQCDVSKRPSKDNQYNIYVEFTRRELIELDDL